MPFHDLWTLARLQRASDISVLGKTWWISAWGEITGDHVRDKVEEEIVGHLQASLQQSREEAARIWRRVGSRNGMKTARDILRWKVGYLPHSSLVVSICLLRAETSENFPICRREKWRSVFLCRWHNLIRLRKDKGGKKNPRSETNRKHKIKSRKGNWMCEDHQPCEMVLWKY